MDYRIRGLDAAPFSHLFGLDDAALAAHGAQRYTVDEKPGFPDRIGLRDLEIGEQAILLNYVHQDADTPYRASHAIFIAENATETYDDTTIPDVMRSRLLSLRAFDVDGAMLDADVVDGGAVDASIEQLFRDRRVAYIHAHYAKRGCFAARIDRA